MTRKSPINDLLDTWKPKGDEKAAHRALNRVVDALNKKGVNPRLPQKDGIMITSIPPQRSLDGRQSGLRRPSSFSGGVIRCYECHQWADYDEAVRIPFIRGAGPRKLSNRLHGYRAEYGGHPICILVGDGFPWPKPPTGKYLRPLGFIEAKRSASYARRIAAEPSRHPLPIIDGFRKPKSKYGKLKAIQAFIDHVRTDGGRFTSLDAYHWIRMNSRSPRSAFRPSQLSNLLCRPFYKRVLRYHVKAPRRHDGLTIYEVEP